MGPAHGGFLCRSIADGRSHPSSPSICIREDFMPRQPPSDTGLREAQALFTTTALPLVEIGRRTQLTPARIRNQAKRDGWTRPAGPAPASRPGRSPAKAKRTSSKSPTARRLDILARALALAEHHIAEAEELLTTPKADVLAREREARFVGTVISLVQRLQQAEAAIRGETAEAGDRSRDDADPATSRGLDAIYRDFALHLAALLGSDAPGPAQGGEGRSC
jgi:hypothetical protein